MSNYKSHTIKYATIILSFLFVGCSQEKIKEDVLWYKQSAKDWNEALPLGNGKLGVMVFGNTSNERIQLNDDSMWPADSDDWNEPEGDKNDLEDIRKLLFEGKNEEADHLKKKGNLADNRHKYGLCSQFLVSRFSSTVRKRSNHSAESHNRRDSFSLRD